MKKIIFSALALGMLMGACQKDKVEQINNNSTEVNLKANKIIRL